MKPNSEQDKDRRGRNSGVRFPLIDCNFQAFPLDRFYGGSTESSLPSFLNISRDYFRYDARRNFVAEVVFFLAIVAIFAVAFVSGAGAIIHFLHLPTA